MGFDSPLSQLRNKELFPINTRCQLEEGDATTKNNGVPNVPVDEAMCTKSNEFSHDTPYISPFIFVASNCSNARHIMPPTGGSVVRDCCLNRLMCRGDW